MLQLAGITLLFLNIVFTPQVLAIESYADMVVSNAYAWRLGFSCLTVLVLILASPGVYQLYCQKTGQHIKGIILLMALLIGNSFLLAHEWNQFLFIRELGISFPDTLEQLNELEGFSLYDLSAIIGISLFFLGWVVSAILLWKAQILNGYVTLLILIGLVASPLLATIIPLVYAGMVSSLLLGSGWFLLGQKLVRLKRP